MAHTPGPWRQSKGELGYKNFDILANSNGWPNVAIATTVDARFCDTGLGTVALDNDVLEANARLIAAAPELLQWIQVLLDQVDYTNGACGVTEIVGGVLDKQVIVQARAAIAKAKGES